MPALAPMQDRLAAYRQGAPLALGAMERVHASIGGRPVCFNLNMPRDPIQNCHRRGSFYEGEELAAMRELIADGAVVLDVGANVGNHAMWFAMVGGASRVIVIEPNPLALEPLVANVIANGLDGVIDLGHIGFGLADRDEGGFFMKEHDRNLGATKMFANSGGSLTVRRGDAVFPDLCPDLVKIDVEGMELEVLAGLEGLIRRARPVMMVEVNNDNLIDFGAWVEANGYDCPRTFDVSDNNANYILVPQRGTNDDRGKDA